MKSQSPSLGFQIPPGFKFRPTDKELLTFLNRKILSSRIHDSIVEYDYQSLFDTIPEDLPGDVREKRFFFAQSTSNNTAEVRNLSSGDGYWKVDGKDQQVLTDGTNQLMGTKKTFVFYENPESKTRWIMNELRLMGSLDAPYLSKSQVVQVGRWIVCRLFQEEDFSNEYSIASQSTESGEISSSESIDSMDDVTSKEK